MIPHLWDPESPTTQPSTHDVQLGPSFFLLKPNITLKFETKTLNIQSTCGSSKFILRKISMLFSHQNQEKHQTCGWENSMCISVTGCNHSKEYGRPSAHRSLHQRDDPFSQT